jgi:DNA mismatch repair protein MutS
LTIIQQYRDHKAVNPETVLLFRCGDFYEAFAEDAEVISPLLGLKLVGCDPGLHMAGFPARLLSAYLPKLKESRKVEVIEE